MDSPISFPILRAKAGEIDAIGRLAPVTRNLVRPVLDFPQQRPGDARPLAYYFSEKIREITSSWGTSNAIFLDFSRYEPQTVLSDGQHAVDYVFKLARQSHLKSVPVIGPLSLRGPGTDYFEAVARVAAHDRRGVAIRVPFEDFASATALRRVLLETLMLVSLSPAEADVYLDAGPLALVPPESGDDLALARIVRAAALSVRSLGFRRVVWAASNLPDSVVHHAKGDVLRVPRTEFQVWRRLHRDPELVFLQYGDYGIIHPSQVESDAKVIPPSRVRVTTDDEFVLYKGARDEMRSIAAVAVRSGLLGGRISWGASAVRGCAEGYGSIGRPVDWVARDTNMHIENTVAAVKNILGIGTSPTSHAAAEASLPWLQEPLIFWPER